MMTENSDETNNHDDEFWIVHIRNGDEYAFEMLFKKYYLPLTRFAWRYVNSRAVAEELVQELFTILWEKKRDVEYRRIGAFVSVQICPESVIKPSEAPGSQTGI